MMRRRQPSSSSPPPWGDGAETPGGRRPYGRDRPCSPLPWGDGAETFTCVPNLLLTNLLAVPSHVAMALKPTTPQRICLHFLALALFHGLSRGSQRVD